MTKKDFIALADQAGVLKALADSDKSWDATHKHCGHLLNSLCDCERDDRLAMARAILATLRESYLGLPLAERIATKRTLHECALAQSIYEGKDL